MTAQALVFGSSIQHRFNYFQWGDEANRYSDPASLTAHVCTHGMHLTFDRFTKVIDGHVICLLPGKRPKAHLSPCDGSCRARSFLSTFIRSVRNPHDWEDDYALTSSVHAWKSFSEKLRTTFPCTAKTYGRIYYSESCPRGTYESWCFEDYHLSVERTRERTQLSHPTPCDGIWCRSRHLTLPKSIAQKAQKASERTLNLIA